jgi:Rieske Fe-S protein
MNSDDQLGRVAQPAGGPLGRRAALAVGGVAGVSAALAVAGCAGAPAAPDAAAPQSNPPNGNPPNGNSPGATGGESSTSGSAAQGGAVLGPASQVPVGGGTVFADQAVVVTQPTAGTFKAFSATCTHKGCTINKVSGGTINCPCHGSKFHIADGSVAHGPATEALPAKRVTNSGGALKLG